MLWKRKEKKRKNSYSLSPLFSCFGPFWVQDLTLRVLNLASNLLSIHKLCLQNNALCYFDAYRFSIQDLPSRKISCEGFNEDGVHLILASSSLYSSSSNSMTYTTSLIHQTSKALALSSIKSA